MDYQAASAQIEWLYLQHTLHKSNVATDFLAKNGALSDNDLVVFQNP